MSGSAAPLCTIAIPVYHRMEKALAFAAVESALREPRADVEIVVIDDHTTDGTWDRLTRLVPDPRARLLRNERNLGLFQNFNRCLDEARGRYVRVLCSDDVLEPGSLDAELAIMERHPDIALLTTRGLRVDAAGRVLGLQAAAIAEGRYAGDRAIATVLRGNTSTGYNALNYPSGILLRRTAADRAGRFRDDMKMSGDVEYFLRVLRHGALGVVERVGCRITVHDDQVGSRLSLDAVVMRELFALADEFHDVLVAHGCDVEVRRHLIGLGAWLAARAVARGEPGLARAQRAVLRDHGARDVELATELLRLVARRLRWRARGPFVPRAPAPDAAL